jgi:motility quorum-sensing regulator/GCU-specific mRNA interferase toxin
MVLCVTKKPTPTYNLDGIKAAALAGDLNFTLSATKDATSMGFSSSDVRKVIANLRSDDFYKTMPSTNVPGAWQDIYKPVVPDVGQLYVKFGVGGKTVVEVKLVSFKPSTSK